MDLKLRAPVEGFMLNFAASAPPFKLQVTVSFAENVWTEVNPCSSTDLLLLLSPGLPEGPVIFGASSSTF